MEKWFCRVDGQEFGPLTAIELRDLAQRGGVDENTPVRNSQGGPWQEARSIAGLLTPEEPLGVAEGFRSMSSKVRIVSSRERYAALRARVASGKSSGNVLVIAFASLWGMSVLCGLTTGTSGASLVIGSTILAIAMAPVLWIIRRAMIASAELIEVQIDTEENTREAVRCLQQLLNAMEQRN